MVEPRHPIVRVFTLVLAGMLTDPAEYRLKSSNDKYYVLVIDAGSTGSRAHVYRFSVDLSTGVQDFYGKIRLEDDQRVSTTPGLSSYVKHVNKSGESIVKLIKQAKDFVPLHRRADTPLIVRATAGMRLLDEKNANKILDNVRKSIANLGYKVDKHSVAILKEYEEGINMWYAVNLLTNSLATSNRFTAIEMGGSSAQVAFDIDPEEIHCYNRNDIYVRPAICNTLVFSHSYLGQGITSARYQALRIAGYNVMTVTGMKGEHKPPHIRSVCVDDAVQNRVEHFYGHNVSISGVSRKGLTPQGVYERCKEVVLQIVKETMTGVKANVIPGKVAAMGYYYWLAVNEGHISKDGNGVITTGDLYWHAVGPNGGCATSNTSMPWRCFDLVFTVVLLEIGYRIKQDTAIFLYNDIDGYAVEWSLGLAYNYVMAEIAAKPGPAHVFYPYLKSVLAKR